MRTVVLGEHSELSAMIARRRAMGQDLHDEVWHGEYHMAPSTHGWHGRVESELAGVLRPLVRRVGLVHSGPVNVGVLGNFRVPDAVLHRRGYDLDEVWFDTVAMAIEVVSPGDESWLKFDHYAEHGVDEVLIADPRGRTLDLFVLADGGYERRDRSDVLDVAVAELHAAIDWPGPPAPASSA